MGRPVCLANPTRMDPDIPLGCADSPGTRALSDMPSPSDRRNGIQVVLFPCPVLVPGVCSAVRLEEIVRDEPRAVSLNHFEPGISLCLLYHVQTGCYCV